MKFAVMKLALGKNSLYMKHTNVVNIVYIYKHSIFMDGKTNTNAE